MKPLRYTLFAAAALFAACNNMPADDANIIKAYPNPYDAAAGVLTIERSDGSAFAAQNDLVIYDFNLAEVYRANIHLTRRLARNSSGVVSIRVVLGLPPASITSRSSPRAPPASRMPTACLS